MGSVCWARRQTFGPKLDVSSVRVVCGQVGTEATPYTSVYLWTELVRFEVAPVAGLSVASRHLALRWEIARPQKLAHLAMEAMTLQSRCDSRIDARHAFVVCPSHIIGYHHQMRLESLGATDFPPEAIGCFIKLPILVRAKQVQVHVLWTHGKVVREVRHPLNEGPGTSLLIIKQWDTIGGTHEPQIATVLCHPFIIVDLYNIRWSCMFLTVTWVPTRYHH